MRRSLGFRLTTQGHKLMSFVRFCEARQIDHVRADLALEWATTTEKASVDEVHHARRLDVFRIFARRNPSSNPLHRLADALGAALSPSSLKPPGRGEVLQWVIV